jgi:hypothetical protein
MPRIGPLVTKASVKTTAQKREAAQFAKAVPSVREVVDEIQVNGNKDATNQ